MSIDDYARWLSRVTLAFAIIMIGWGLSVVLSQPVTAWFAASATIWMALLLISAVWHLVRRAFCSSRGWNRRRTHFQILKSLPLTLEATKSAYRST